MTSVVSVLRYMPKSVAIYIAAILAIVTSVATVAQNIDVFIEGNLGVKNITTNTTGYGDFVNATDNQEVEFRVYYHNTELPASGKVAEDMSVKVDFPTNPGAIQEVMATIRGTNTNTVVDTASVNLGNDDAYLEFIPGSVLWEHNIGSDTNINMVVESLPDSVVTGDGFTVIEDQQPCFEYEAWIYFRAYVRTPDVEIEKSVSVDDSDWANSATAEADELVKYLLTIRNTSQAVLNDVNVKDILPADQTYVSGSTKLFNNANPSGITVADGVTSENGINIGSLGAGEVAYVGFRANVAGIESLECGLNEMVNRGQVTTGSLSDEDTATVNVERICETQEFVYSCEALATVIDASARQVRAELSVTKSDNVTVSGYQINFGDGTTVNEQTATHTYSQDGTYTITGTVTFDVDGEQQQDTCVDQVTIDNDQPDVLPNTGPGSIIGALFGTGSAFAAARSWIASRRTLRASLLA